jgi:hypothetical protein
MSLPVHQRHVLLRSLLIPAEHTRDTTAIGRLNPELDSNSLCSSSFDVNYDAAKVSVQGPPSPIIGARQQRSQACDVTSIALKSPIATGHSRVGLHVASPINSTCL